MGRPKKAINGDEVVKLAAMGCTPTEIAAFFSVSHKTISVRFSKEVAKGQDHGKTKLRKLMWKSADSGNVTMQIWLSKNILGYSDKVEQKNETSISLVDQDAAKLTDQQLIDAYQRAMKGGQ